jgi:hypothetical protein
VGKRLQFAAIGGNAWEASATHGKARTKRANSLE